MIALSVVPSPRRILFSGATALRRLVLAMVSTTFPPDPVAFPLDTCGMMKKAELFKYVERLVKLFYNGIIIA